jgi:hypothetical protein
VQKLDVLREGEFGGKALSAAAEYALGKRE